MYLHDGKAGLTTTRTDFRGGIGQDTATYDVATAGVILTKDGVANDGRTLTGSSVIDRDNIRPDVERLIGSRHNDSLNGSQIAPFPGKLLEHFDGNQGSDIMTGGPAEDAFEMGRDAEGADIVRGGGGRDAVFYAKRTAASTSASATAHATTAASARATTSPASSRWRAARARHHLPGPGLDRRPVRLRRRRRRHPDRRERPRPADGAGRCRLHERQRRRRHADRQRRRARHARLRHQPCGRPDSATRDAVETAVRNCESSQVGKLSLKAPATTSTSAGRIRRRGRTCARSPSACSTTGVRSAP